MRKKYYIFVLTFLCLLCGQMSYAGDVYGGELEALCIDVEHEIDDSDFCTQTTTTTKTAYMCDSGNILDIEISVDIEVFCELQEYVDCNDDIDGYAYESYCGCIGGNTGIDECPVEDETPPEEPQEPTCNITSCPAGYVVVNCECVCPEKVKALLADLVYDSHNGIPNDYSKLPDNVMIINPVTIPGVQFTDTNIGFNSTLYRVDNGNGNVEYVYATEGSTLELQDWLNNGQQATGNIAAQYDLSVDNAIKIQQWASTQGTLKISFTGHSLGGGLANANALATGYPATVYNPAGLHDNTISRLGLNLSYENRVNYYVNTGEIVDIANTLLSTPARGIRHKIGNNAVVPAAVWYTSTLAGVIYSGYLHTMGSVLANLDCN